MKKISITQLSKDNKINSKELFSLLQLNNYIIKNGEKWELLELGTKNGGEIKKHFKFGDYIIFPENIDINKIKNSKNIKINESDFLTATEISKHFNISSAKVNLLFLELGYIKKEIKGWDITNLGLSSGGKKYTYGPTGQTYIKWINNILEDINLVEAINYENKYKNIANNNSTTAQPQNIPQTIKKPLNDEIKGFREKFPAEIRTKDGHQVRSRAEAMIDNLLYEYGLVHAYERKIPVSERIYCDFYIPSHNGGDAVYIEFWGLEEQDAYKDRKITKQNIYKKYNLNLIELNNTHLNILDDYLPKMLLEYNIKVI